MFLKTNSLGVFFLPLPASNAAKYHVRSTSRTAETGMNAKPPATALPWSPVSPLLPKPPASHQLVFQKAVPVSLQEYQSRQSPTLLHPSGVWFNIILERPLSRPKCISEVPTPAWTPCLAMNGIFHSTGATHRFMLFSFSSKDTHTPLRWTTLWCFNDIPTPARMLQIQDCAQCATSKMP